MAPEVPGREPGGRKKTQGESAQPTRQTFEADRLESLPLLFLLLPTYCCFLDCPPPCVFLRPLSSPGDNIMLSASQIPSQALWHATFFSDRGDHGDGGGRWPDALFWHDFLQRERFLASDGVHAYLLWG